MGNSRYGDTGAGGSGGGGGLFFRTPTDIFTGADLAACRTARNTYFVATANVADLNQFQSDQFLSIVLDPANSTDNVFETFLPGNSDGLRQTGREFNLDAANATPRGFAASTTYAYVVDDAGEKVFVYSLPGGAQQASLEFPIHSTNSWPVGIAVNATNAYVADRTTTKVFVYLLADGSRQTAQEIDLAAGNTTPSGIAVSATHAYVLNFTDRKVYVYLLADGSHQPAQEFSLHSDNGNPEGITINATYAYVVDSIGRKVYAYILSGGAQETSQEFGLVVDNDTARGMAVDANYAYIVDFTDSKVYVYLLPGYDSTKWVERTGSIQGNPGPIGSDATVNASNVDPLIAAYSGGIAGLSIVDAQIPSAIMRDAEFTAATVRTMLGLTATEVDDLLTGASINGQVVTFPQTDGSQVTITIPSSASTSVADGVVESGAFNAAGTELILTLDTADTVTINVPALLRSTATGGFTLRSGTGVPDASLGADGDWYLRTSNGAMYLKASGSWSVVYTDQIGQAGSGITESAANTLIQTALAASVTGNTETGIVVTYNADETVDYIIQAAPQTHTNFVGITTGELSAVVIADFTVSGITAALTIPAYTGSRRLLFARPASEADPSAVYLYLSGNRNTVNQLSTFTKSVSAIQLGGESHNWWGNVGLQSGAGGYVLEQIN